MRLDPENSREMGHYFALAQAGIEMVVPIGIGVALDEYLGWSPWCVVIGAILGLTIGLTHLVVMANKKSPGPPPPPAEDNHGSHG